MNVKWLEAFRLVVERRSFTRAAEALDLSQPAVSQQVRNLERHFGAPLLTQAGRGIELTPAGEKVYRTAVQVDDHLRRLEAELADLAHNPSGRVRIVCGPTVLCHYVPRLLRRFWAEYPAVMVQTFTNIGRPITDDVLAGRADIGIQSVAHFDARLTATPCIEERLLLVCAPAHPLAGRAVVRPHDLLSLKIGALGRGSEARRLIDEWAAAADATFADLVEFSAAETMRAAAITNTIAGFVPESAVREDLHLGRLYRVPIDGPKAPLVMYAIHGSEPSHATTLMLEVIAKQYANPEFWDT